MPDLDFVAFGFDFLPPGFDFVAPGLDFVAAGLDFISRESAAVRGRVCPSGGRL
jgi:hypothetical protein